MWTIYVFLSPHFKFDVVACAHTQIWVIRKSGEFDSKLHYLFDLFEMVKYVEKRVMFVSNCATRNWFVFVAFKILVELVMK